MAGSDKTGVFGQAVFAHRHLFASFPPYRGVSIAAPIFLVISLLGFWLKPATHNAVPAPVSYPNNGSGSSGNTNVSSADMQLCSGKEDPGQVVAACTRLIQAGGQAVHDIGSDYYFRGVAENREGQSSAAQADLTQAIQRIPNFADAYDSRSMSEGAQNDLQGVLNDSAAALKIQPNDVNALLNQATAYTQEGSYPQAMTAINAAINLSPSNVTYAKRGLIELDQKQSAAAVQDYTQALQYNPGDAASLANKGYAEYLLGEYSAAVADGTASLKLNPNDAAAQRDLALAQAKLAGSSTPSAGTGSNENGTSAADKQLCASNGDANQVIPACTRLLQAGTQSAGDIGVDHYFIGYAELRGGQYGPAIAELTQTIQSNPNDELALANRAYSEFKLGEYSAAVNDDTAALKLNPNNTTAQGVLNAAQAKLGQ